MSVSKFTLSCFTMLASSVFFVVSLHMMRLSEACNGFKLYVDYFRNCGKNNIIILSEDFRPVLHDDCSVTMNGCTTIKKSFKSAQMNFDISKNGARYRGTKNACQALEGAHGEALSIMETIGAPSSCPVKEGIMCGYGKEVSIRKHRLTLPMMSGTTRGKMELKTNAGNACFEFSASLNRRLFSG